MRILFLHQNFPGQFKHLAPALAAAGHQVVALPMRAGEGALWQGVRLLPYMPQRGSTKGIHPWAADLETKIIRGEACARAMLQLRRTGFTPDLVIAHPGWGESLFVKDIWPATRLGLYCEFHYRASGADMDFDPEFAARDPLDACRIRLKNANNLLHFEQADGALSPTRWQANTFPAPFRQRIEVAHDGIDTAALAPDPAARLQLADGRELTRADEVVSFVSRNLEPYRGYHVFMRALPELLRRRPRARVLIVGGDGTGYGAPPPGGRTWREIFTDEVRPQMPATDWARVHFLGKLPYPRFIAMLQVATVHTYLTYPFVLSWSLLEAMSIGCAIVASDSAPVREAISDGETGRLVDFFAPAALAGTIARLLDAPAERHRLGQAARRHACQHYDLRSVCLPAQLTWAARLGQGR